MTFGKRLLRRLKDRSGESITEVLVAVLISAVGIVLLAGMITSATHMITASRNKIETYVNSKTVLVDRDSDDKAGTGTVTVEWGAGETEIKLTDKSASSGIPVEYFSDGVYADHVVISYR